MQLYTMCLQSLNNRLLYNNRNNSYSGSRHKTERSDGDIHTPMTHTNEHDNDHSNTNIVSRSFPPTTANMSTVKSALLGHSAEQ